MRHQTVLFDLDGTLIDSGAMILASLRHATRTVLRREIADEHLLAAVGGAGLRDQMTVLDAERADELVTAYREHNEPLHGDLQGFDGVEGVLAELRGEGRKLGVVTAKRHATVELAFAVIPLGAYFDAIVGWDDTERHKPHPDPLLTALERLGAAPKDAAYVGDSPFDIAAAKAAGVFSVAATWGGIHPRERLEAEEPDVFVARPEELLAVL
jgi:pyrophosphatase PpaX